jgi:hypothetical protein
MRWIGGEMGQRSDWAWLCEDGEEPMDVTTPPLSSGQAFWFGFTVGIVLAMIALIVGWAVSA